MIALTLRCLLVASTLLSLGSCHDQYWGDCPSFDAMRTFNWDLFSGRWYAVEKFDTDSRCLTYDFNEDEYGNRDVTQVSQLDSLKKLSVDNKVKYRGRLSFPSSKQESDMIVKFPLSVLGSASYVVLDTDYDNYALVCTCQQQQFVFQIFTMHRRSCTILQRKPERSQEHADEMHDILNKKLGENSDHDFDIIQHANCNYEDDGKGLEIDVDKILKSTKDETEAQYLDFYDGDWEPEESNLVKEGVVEWIDASKRS